MRGGGILLLPPPLSSPPHPPFFSNALGGHFRSIHPASFVATKGLTRKKKTNNDESSFLIRSTACRCLSIARRPTTLPFPPAVGRARGFCVCEGASDGEEGAVFCDRWRWKKRDPQKNKHNSIGLFFFHLSRALLFLGRPDSHSMPSTRARAAAAARRPRAPRQPVTITR